MLIKERVDGVIVTAAEGQIEWIKRLFKEGYKEALRAAGKGFDSALVVQGDFTFEGGKQAIAKLVEGSGVAIPVGW